MAETITMPKLGFDMAEGTLVRWVRNEGENINKGDVLAEIETDKATVEVESSASGVVRKLLVDQGAVVPIGAPIAIVGSADEILSESATSAPVGSKQKPESDNRKSEIENRSAAPQSSIVNQQSSMVKASPLAKKIARDNQVDLSHVQGTGPGGRIIRKDIEAALSSGIQTADRRPQAVVSSPSSVLITSHEDEIVTPTRLRQAVARRMTESKITVPHFYVTHEYKMDGLLDLRKQVNAYLPNDQKVSVNDFVVKAVAMTLREFPNLNSALQGDKVLRHGSVNIGVAVAVEGGLLTVVCKDTDQKPLRQISNEVKRMAAGAREGKVKPDDIEGSTFSISNLGMFDVENFAAIINPPEAGILAIGSAREVPVVIAGPDGHPPVLGIGWRMKATISVDHRVSDGAEGARFMQALAKYIEEPLRLLV
jgi:pyruvate dehydrogenase E2 component (dihydrolipoamide acetyltransferase)